MPTLNDPRGAPRRPQRVGRSGQAMVESCLVIAVMSLVLFGLLEVSRQFMAREVLHYSASAGARAHAVGFNDFMIYKVIRTAAIPVAGRMNHPDFVNNGPAAALWSSQRPGTLWDFALRANPISQQYEQVERSRIPLYLGADDWGQLTPILDYDDWDDLHGSTVEIAGNAVEGRARQDVEMRYGNFHRAFYARDFVEQDAKVEQESHFSGYLNP